MVNSTIKMKNKGRKQSIKKLNKGGMHRLGMNRLTGFFKGRSTSIPEATTEIPVPGPEATTETPVPTAAAPTPPLISGIGNRVYESMIEIRKQSKEEKSLLNRLISLQKDNNTAYTTGYGQSGMAAQYLAGCLRCLGINSLYFTPEGFEHGECLKVKNEDILISFGSVGGLPQSDAWDKAKEKGGNSEFESLLRNIYSIGADGTNECIEIVEFERNNLPEDKRSTFSNGFKEKYIQGIKIQQDTDIKQFAKELKDKKDLKLPVGVQDAFFTFIHALLLTLQDDFLSIYTKPKSSDSISKETAAVVAAAAAATHSSVVSVPIVTKSDSTALLKF